MTIADTVKRLSPPLYRLRIFVIIIAVLGLPFTVYYLSYVRSQSSYFTDRSFRKLSTISSQISSRVESAASVLKNSSEKFIRPSVQEENSVRFSTDPAHKQDNLDGLKEVFKRLKGDRQIIPLQIDTEPWGDKVSAGTVTLNTVRHEADSSWLYLDYVSEGIKEKTVIRVQAKTDLNRLIQPFLSERVGSDYDQFQNILITEADTSRVIFQYDASQVRLASLDKLPASEDGAKKIDLKEIAQSSNVTEVSLAGSNYRLFSHPLKLSLPCSTANSPNTTWITSGLIKSNYFQTEAWSISIPYTILIIGGFLVALLVFSWPFLKLVLAGPKDRVKPQDVYFLIFATIVVLAVVTCFGLYAYVYSTVEGRMDVQLETLAKDIKKNFNEELTEALKQLDILGRNGEIIKQLDLEEEQRKAEAKAKAKANAKSPRQHKSQAKRKVNTAHASGATDIYQQRDLNKTGILAKAKSTGQHKSKAKRGKKAAHASGATDIYQQRDLNKTGILPAVIKSKSPYLYFDGAVWIDSTAMQRAKWSIKNYNTQYISVSGRAYFDNLRKNRYYKLDQPESGDPLDPDDDVADHKFWLEPVVSRNTGRNQVEISMEIPKTNWILALDTRLVSLMDPVLPAGYGYAIISNDGKVVFHSDEAHHLGEDLFQECDDDPKLLSAIAGRNQKALNLNVRYLGDEHRFLITTLKGFPDWSLIVFRNKQPLRSVFFELLTSVSVLFLIYGLILMAGFTVFYLFNVVNERRAWLWPSEKKTAIYIQSIFLLLGVSLISLALIIWLHGQQLVWLAAGIGLVSGFAYFVNFRWGLRSPFLKYFSRLTDRIKRYDRAYVLNATLLLLLVAILPAGAFFKYAYESQIELFIKHAQYSIATALAKRDDRIRAQYSNIKFKEEAPATSSKSKKRGDESKEPEEESRVQEKNSREDFVTKRLAKSWDVYDEFFFQTNHEGPGMGPASGPEDGQTDLLAKLNTVLPLSDRASIERRGLLDNTSVAGVGKWKPAAKGTLALQLEGSAGQPASRSHLNTSVPLLGRPGFAATAFVVLLFPLFLFVSYMIRKVFVLDAHKSNSHSLKRLLSEKIDRNVFVVVNAPFVKKVPGNGSNIYLKDLPSITTSADWADTFDYASAGEGAVIALDQFDYGMDDPHLNQQKLRLVENLLRKQRTLMLFSSAESSQYRFTNGENGHTNGDRDHAGRWGVIISDFFTEYAEDTDDKYAEETGNGSSFKEKVDQHKARILAQGLQERSAKEADELFHILYVECAPREPLQRVGLKILSQKGFLTLSREDLIVRIVNEARVYYTHIWNSCSPGERQTLCHLAQDRLLSHRDPDIEPLLRRELIVREHDLHLFNDSFRQFVKSAEQVSFVADQDKTAQQGSLWQTLRVPILMVLVGIAAFLFLTQQDLYSRSIALVTGITTLIPALFKVLSMFHSDPISRPPN
jgi:hypothetical protein